jgi:hypothetical protein
VVNRRLGVFEITLQGDLTIYELKNKKTGLEGSEEWASRHRIINVDPIPVR